MLQETYLLQFFISNLYHFGFSPEVFAPEPFAGSHNQVGRLQSEQIVYHLETFCHELSFFISVLLQFERTYVLYFILANHLFFVYMCAKVT